MSEQNWRVTSLTMAILASTCMQKQARLESEFVKDCHIGFPGRVEGVCKNGRFRSFVALIFAVNSTWQDFWSFLLQAIVRTELSPISGQGSVGVR